MIKKAVSFALISSLGILLAACGADSRGKPRMAATPAEDPSNPWATYAAPDWDHDRTEVRKTGSGLEYIVLATGENCVSGPTDADQAFVHYEGRLTDGTVFDSSLSRNRGINFGANQVIRGWTEALELMCPGDDWLVYLPSDMAYGAAGSGNTIGPNADLIFRVILMADISADDWSGASFK